MSRLPIAFGIVIGVSVSALACGSRTGSPAAPSSEPSASAAPIRAMGLTGPPWGPETPPFNLEVVLRGQGFGLVKFRQPNDDKLIINLDVWVRDLNPDTAYSLQRAVDSVVDGNCTSNSWLTLGKGVVPQAIVTDDRGTGRAQLFRDVSAFPVGKQFDIHFRVVDAATSEVVLTSACYQFTISQ